MNHSRQFRMASPEFPKLRKLSQPVMCPRKYPWRPFAYPVAFPVPPGAYVNMFTYGNPPILVVPPYIYTPGCYEVKFCGWLIGIYENTGGAIPLWSVAPGGTNNWTAPFRDPGGITWSSGSSAVPQCARSMPTDAAWIAVTAEESIKGRMAYVESKLVRGEDAADDIEELARDIKKLDEEAKKREEEGLHSLHDLMEWAEINRQLEDLRAREERNQPARPGEDRVEPEEMDVP